MKLIMLSIAMCAFCATSWAETASEDLSMFFEEKDMIEIASKHLQSTSTAPATVSVISSKEIRNSGVRNLFDLLQREFGFSGMTVEGKRVFEVRGANQGRSTNYKLMVDGHSVHDDLGGSPSWVFENLSIDNVKRVEIIRGPGSALYGSGAFVAVVNVITRNGSELNGASVTAGRGTYATDHYNIQAGKQYQDGDAALHLDFYDTDGPRLHVASDAVGQSGNTDFNQKKFDAGLKLVYQDWSFNSRYLSIDRGPYVGAAGVLNDGSQIQLDQYFAELAHQKKLGSVDFKGKAYLDYLETDTYLQIKPPALYPYPPGGMILNPTGKMRSHGVELQMDTPLTSQHLATLGLLMERRAFTDVRNSANFDARLFVGGAPNPFFGAPLGAVMDVTNGGSWLDDKTKRTIRAVYLQDVWAAMNDLDLTLGIRHDKYSDVGGTTNPRAALVWQFSDDWDMKALYGKAFRAPSFQELYLINDPTNLGNATLKPERMETRELSLGHAFNPRNKTRLTYFSNRIKNTIALRPAVISGYPLQQLANIGVSKAQGLELEYDQKNSSGHSLIGKFTYQDAVDLETNTPSANVARYKANVGANLLLSRYFNLNINVNSTGSTPRSPVDTRKDRVAGRTLVDMAVIAKDFRKDLELRLAVFNLLNKTYVDPSPAGSVPSDFPREGRNAMLEFRYSM